MLYKKYFLKNYMNDLTLESKQATKTEEKNLEKIEDKVCKIVKEDEILKKHKIEQYLQGSFANDTNIKDDSDIDIVLELRMIFGYDIEGLSVIDENKAKSYYAEFPLSNYRYEVFKEDVCYALYKRSKWNIEKGKKVSKYHLTVGMQMLYLVSVMRNVLVGMIVKANRRL